MSDNTTVELDTKLDQLIARGEEIKAKLDSTVSKEDLEALQTEQGTIRQQVEAITTERAQAKAKADHDLLMQFMAEQKAEAARKPSKAAQIGTLIGERADDKDPFDTFFATVAQARSRDYDEQRAAKAKLAEMGVNWSDVPAESKATLGTTDAAGGYLIPNNVVADVIEQATARNPWREMLTVVRGVRGTAVDQPTEGLAPARASVVGWGDTKPNVDLTTANYTATLYTLAVIYDVANQFLRHSGGAAERLIRSRTARSIALGEAHYILNGSGTNEPKGILTSVGTSGDFVTSFTASATTLAGSVATAIATAAGVVEGRNREATAAVVHPEVYWLMARQGTDNAGFFFAPAGGPEGIRPGTLMSPFGIPVYKDANMPSDDLLVGDFRSMNLFIGDDYRVDVSNEAGDRWDKNLTGFRAEEELAFNADAFVASGFVQRILDVVP